MVPTFFTFRTVIVAAMGALCVMGARADLLIDPAGGTVLFHDANNHDDAVMPARSLGFEFSFFDELITEIDVSTNGNLNTSGNTDYANELPLAEVARISPLWDDLEVLKGSGDKIVENVKAGTWYAVTWIVHERGNRAARHAFQAVLFGAAERVKGFDFAAGDIVFSYEQVGPSFNKGNATMRLDAGDGETFSTAASLVSSEGLVTVEQAGVLPVGPGRFVLFHFDEDEADYVVTVNNNGSPVAADDTRYVAGRRAIDIAVLANDLDPDGDVLDIESFQQGAFGTVAIRQSGVLRYTPGSDFAGSDTFTYMVRDHGGLAATATVRLMSFAAAKGTHEGLITDEIDPEDPEASRTNEGAGFLSVRLGAGGALTGTLRYGGFTHKLSGAFDAHGNFTANVNRTVDGERETVTIMLHLDATNSVRSIIGTVSGDATTSTVAAGRARFSARSLPAPQAGKYTALMKLGEESEGPAGIGYALMKVRPSGSVEVAGKLGDGTPFTAGAFVKLDGTFAFHVPLRGPRRERGGGISGIARFQDLAGTSDCDATLNWFKPDTTAGAPGFEAIAKFEAARYERPDPGTRVLVLAEGRGNAEADIGGDFVATLTVDARNKVLVDDAGDQTLALSIDAKRGMFRGYFLEESPGDPEVLVKRKFSGAIQQKQNAAGGLFVAEGESNYVTVAAPETEIDED